MVTPPPPWGVYSSTYKYSAYRGTQHDIKQTNKQTNKKTILCCYLSVNLLFLSLSLLGSLKAEKSTRQPECTKFC